jgi:GAF domain-containing protein
LHLKVGELEGKDRITQHMLVVHSLEETLAVVLDVVTNITGVDQAVVYTKSDDEWTAVAATGLVGEELGDRPAKGGALGEGWRQALSQVERELEPLEVQQEHPCTLVPVARGRQLIGAIEVANPRSSHAISAADVRTLSSFALLAAVAISDAQVRFDPDEWEHQLDRVFESEDGEN